MPQGAAPRALLAVIALIMAIAVAVVPVVDARPKDKKHGDQEVVVTESEPGNDSGAADVVTTEAPADAVPREPAPEQGDSSSYSETATMAEPVVTAQEGTTATSNERTLLSSDADGDYLPDALDNCPTTQNPDQADSDGDGAGDACPVYADYDGDGVPDKEDNCPNIATSDFSDSDGDGIGDSCDKSPDGVEPEPEPVAYLDGKGGGDEPAAPEPVNGSGEDGKTVERDGRERSRQRTRTDTEKPIITTDSDTAEGADTGAAEGDTQITEGPNAEPYVEPARDNPRRNEELVAEAAASGELYAPPEPPPTPSKAWDEEAEAISWDAVIRIDAGATADAARASAADDQPGKSRRSRKSGKAKDANTEDLSDDEVGDSGFARGWMRARLLLQEDDAPQDDAGDSGESGASAPVPVENGLVIRGTEEKATQDQADKPDREPARESAKQEPLDSASDAGDTSAASERPNRAARKGDSRRDGSSRAAAAAPERGRATDERASASDGTSARGEAKSAKQPKRAKSGGKRRQARAGNRSAWSDDRYFAGGSALDWSGDVGVAGTDEDGLYLTQRSGTGPGKRRGFAYAIPLEDNGRYLVRLYFAEPYWGAPGGPEAESGLRVFSVSAEGDTIVQDLDIFDEVGPLTALVKQAEVTVDDGELNLRFTASEGEPIVAAIEILEPAR